MQKPSFLEKWTKFFIDKHKVSILFLIAIVIAGIWGNYTLQRQDFPQIKSNYVFVSATYPGASSEDVEQKVILPIENVVNNLDDIDTVRSTAMDNFAQISIERTTSENNEAAASEIKDEVSRLALPEDVNIEVNQLEVAGVSMVIGVFGEDETGLDKLIEEADKIKPYLESSSKDIEKVEVMPADEYRVNIDLDMVAMNEKSVDYNTVKNAITSNISSFPGGQLKEDEKNLSITFLSLINNIDDIKNIKIGEVVLDDLADIKRVAVNSDAAIYGGYKDENGETYAKESVYLMVYKSENGDVVNMSQAVNDSISELKSKQIIDENIRLETLYDTSPFITDQINSLFNNGLIGLLVILIVLLFFINFRTAVVVSLIIPLAFLITLFVMLILGYSLNILTLFAMILTLGILVDNAIVIAEGIAFEMHAGKSKKEAAILAVRNYGPAVTAATLTTIIAFIPFAQLPGIIGEFMRYIPLTIIIMLVSSYFLAISITPLLGTWILKDDKEEVNSIAENEKCIENMNYQRMPKWQKYLVLPMIVKFGQSIINRINNAYCRFMQATLKSKGKKITVILISFILLAISVGYYLPKLDFEQFPSKDGNVINVTVDFPAEMTKKQQKEVYTKINEKIIDIQYFEKFYAYRNNIQIQLTKPEDRDSDITAFEIVNDFDKELDKIRSEINKDIEIKAEAMSYGPPIPEYDITVEFLSNDDKILQNAVNDLTDYINDKEYATKIKNSINDDLVESIEVKFDKDKLLEYNVNSTTANSLVNSVFSDYNLGTISVQEDGVSDDLYLGYRDEDKNSIDKLKELDIPTNNLQILQNQTNNYLLTQNLKLSAKLDEIAQINKVSKPYQTNRLDGERVATINIALNDDLDSTEIETKIKDYLNDKKLESLKLSDSQVVYGGQLAEFQSDYSNLQIVFILAIILVFLVLVYQFNSYGQPILILLTIPLALIGVFPALYYFGSSLNLVSGLGVIALVGIVVNDAIVLVDTYNRYKKQYKYNNAELLVKTGFNRLKPILSTSITTIVGILPLTLRDPFWTGLGVSIIFGLILSTFGTLVVIPVVYHSILKKK